MIPDAEVRRIARRAGVEPRVVDLDYVLGWALHGLAAHSDLAGQLLFKGGTCLRKCYFADYRFSEDLDFTATKRFDPADLERSVKEAFRFAHDLSGIDFDAEAARMEILNDEYGRESIQLRIYYRGPHRTGGSPRAIRLDVNRDEVIVFPHELRRVIHDFSDKDEFGDIAWPCYRLEEVMAEKLRALLGQRRFAVSRDLFDIYRLLQVGVDGMRVREALPAKLDAKGLAMTTVTADRMLSRKAEFLADWTRNLTPLVQPVELPEFEAAWEATAALLKRVVPP